MQIIVVPAGWSWRLDRAIKRELAAIAADQRDPANDWLVDNSPERTMLIVDSSDLLGDVVSAAITAARPAVRRRQKSA
ncbi:MAG TPA: hypothetical protein VKH19_07580 [Gemmatimonadaceae bacterium]|nr:hypothetical protein [Gemmatimonadaceae bacterium]